MAGGAQWWARTLRAARASAAVLVILPALAAPPARANTSWSADGIALFRAERSATATVDLPRDVRLDGRSQGNDSIAVRGGGEAAGIAMVRHPVATGPLSLLAVRTAATESTCSDCPTPALYVTGSERGEGGSVTLARGRYQLYVFGTGAPTEVEIRVAGQSRQVIELTAPYGFAGGSLAARRSPGSHSVSFGQDRPLVHRGVIVSQVSATAAASPATRETCMFDRAVSATEYEPPCLARRTWGATTSSASQDEQHAGLISSLQLVGPGVYGLGGNVSGPAVAAAPETATVAAALWIPFSPAPDPSREPEPQPPSGDPVQRPAERPADGRLAHVTVRRARGTRRVTIRCAAPVRCTGRARLAPGGRWRRFAAGEGRRAVLTLRLPRGWARSVRARRRVQVEVRAGARTQRLRAAAA